MAYKKINSDTVKALGTNYNNDVGFYNAEKDKAKKKALKETLDGRAQKISDQLKKDFIDYEKNAAERYTNIDDRLTRATLAVKEGKEGLATFAKSKSVHDLIKINVLEAMFLQLAQEEKTDDKAYSEAQFAYRNNPVSFDNVHKISGEKYIKPLLAIRQGTIDEGKKHIQPKLDKIGQLQKLAEQLVVQADLLAKGAQGDLSELRNLLATALNEAKEHLTGAKKEHLSAMQTSMANNLDSIRKQAALEKVGPDNVNMIESIQGNMLQQLKLGKQVVDRISKQATQAKSSVTKAVEKDDAIQKSITEIDKAVKGLDGLLATMAKDFKESLTHLEQARKKLKK
jgi:hypothetical protein